MMDMNQCFEYTPIKKINNIKKKKFSMNKMKVNNDGEHTSPAFEHWIKRRFNQAPKLSSKELTHIMNKKWNKNTKKRVLNINKEQRSNRR